MKKDSARFLQKRNKYATMKSIKSQGNATEEKEIEDHGVYSQDAQRTGHK